MAQELCVVVSDEDRVRLEAIIGDRTRPVKHVQRARIVLLSAERLPVLQVAGRAGVSRPAVWRWQRRYAEAGVAGLLRDKTRAPGKQPVAIETVNKVLALTCSDPPGEMTHWTGRAMAKTVGLALHTVQRIWRANRLQPQRCAPSSAPPTRLSPRRSKISSVSTCVRRPMPWCSRSTRNRRSRRSTAPSPVCRSSLVNAGR